jgi:flagellar biosynthesis/type III secretory pathway protein FliH
MTSETKPIPADVMERAWHTPRTPEGIAQALQEAEKRGYLKGVMEASRSMERVLSAISEIVQESRDEMASQIEALKAG